jgi:hypothetical protein
MEETARARLRRILVARFTLSELRDLAFDAGVDDETLAATNKGDLARALITYFEHRHRMDKLLRTIETLRPDIQLRETPFDPNAELVWISIHEAMRITGWGATYLSRLAAEGRLSARREGERWSFDREILLAYLHGWIGTEEAAEVTDYAVSHIRWLAREGVVRAEKAHGIWLIHRESLLAYGRTRGQIE